MMRQYLGVKDVQEVLGISESKAYKVIKQLNDELKSIGYITITGKVNKKYFEERCCYGGTIEN